MRKPQRTQRIPIAIGSAQRAQSWFLRESSFEFPPRPLCEISSAPSAVHAFSRILFIASLLLSITSSAQDTINKTDSTGKKQGYWIITGAMKKSTYHKPEQKVEEGNYIDNKKNGEWISYFANGNIKSNIEYKNNRPNGKYTIYYENGCVEEEGTWKNNVIHGLFKRYTFHGDSCGILIQEKELYPNGKYKSAKYYCEEHNTWSVWSDTSNSWQTEGKVIKCTHITPNEQISEKKYQPIDKEPIWRMVNSENVLYDSTGKPVMKGEYKNGILWNGYKYVYDKNKILIKVEIYKEGKIVSDSVAKENADTAYLNGYYKKYDDQNRLVEDGIFKDGKLWEGHQYAYDKNGLLERIDVLKEGKYSHSSTDPDLISDGDKMKEKDCKCTRVDGYEKIYNEKKLLIYDGLFKCCQLYTGKKYLYDKKDQLKKIEIYKEGKYVGDAKID